MPPSRMNKATHPGIETQRRCHQNSKTGVSVAPQMDKWIKKKLEFQIWSPQSTPLPSSTRQDWNFAETSVYLY